MHTIMICGSDYTSPHELHLALKKMLALPSWYGLNADALNDCLGERGEKLTLWIADSGEGDTARALETVSRVISDNGGRVVKL